MRRRGGSRPDRKRTPWLFMTGYVVLLALVLLGLSARYVHPRYAWWLQLLAIFLPFTSALFALTTVRLVWRQTWALLGVHALVLVLLVLRFWPILPGGATGDAAGGDILRIVSFNHPNLGTEQERSEAAVSLVRRLRPDVLALQEVWFRYRPDHRTPSSRPDVVTLIEQTELTAVATDSGRVRTDQPILTRIPADGVRNWSLPYQNDDSPLEVTRLVVEWKQRPLAVYNVHLASYGERKPWREEDSSLVDAGVWIGYLRRYRHAIRRRAWEVEQVRAIVAQEELPFVLAGDFNATPHNYAYRRLRGDLTDAFEAAGSGWGMTFHRRMRFARIDFILLHDDVEAVWAEVTGDGVSDHLPLLTGLAWRTGP